MVYLVLGTKLLTPEKKLLVTDFIYYFNLSFDTKSDHNNYNNTMTEHNYVFFSNKYPKAFCY